MRHLLHLSLVTHCYSVDAAMMLRQVAMTTVGNFLDETERQFFYYTYFVEACGRRRKPGQRGILYVWSDQQQNSLMIQELYPIFKNRR